MGNILVNGTAHQHVYNYDLQQCTINGSSIPTLQVIGTYNVDTEIAHEELSYHAFGVQADWQCPNDPWSITTGALPCSQVPGNPRVSGHNDSTFDLSEQFEPFSIQYLMASDQYVLGAQLSNALKQPPTPAPLQVIGRATTVNNGAVSSALSTTSAPAPTLPDFKIMAVRAERPSPDPLDKNRELLPNGHTASYDVVVANLGAKVPQISADPSKKPQVQVSIQVTGSLQYLAGSTQIPVGWDCSGSGPILCVGPLAGYGDAVQDTVVTLPLQILGAKSGPGAISATADPNGLFKDSDLTNNANTLAITVK